jgi:polyphosphate:AMP phosphotransferase
MLTEGRCHAMFESAEMGHVIHKSTFLRRSAALREDLLETQLTVLEKAQFPMLVLINGVEGGGKGETVHLLHEWMDARHIITHGFGQHTDEERTRPPMWRFWRALPPKGKVGIFFGSWYSDPILGRALETMKHRDFEDHLDRIVNLEQMLADEGVGLVKLWFHLSKSRQRKRLVALEKDKATRWRVTKRDWSFFDKYDAFRSVSEAVIRRTSTGHAPWHIIEGTDARYRSLTSAKLILDAMKSRLATIDAPSPKPRGAAASRTTPVTPEIDHKNLVNQLDLSQKVAKETYQQKLEKLQGQLNMLSRHKRFRDIGIVVLFEGVDAAGKGGAIRRVTQALDVRSYQVVPIGPPTDEERAQPYLWRFWRHIPRKGKVTIFDRSWYGRVLVERVEGFCSEADWQRAYAEINDFEEQLHASALVLSKFWLQISKGEQLQRFRSRERTGFKRYKITADDWRNRKKWGAYEIAAAEMVDRTSSEKAPWTLVAAEDKYHARVHVLETLVQRIEAALR